MSAERSWHGQRDDRRAVLVSTRHRGTCLRDIYVPCARAQTATAMEYIYLHKDCIAGMIICMWIVTYQKDNEVAAQQIPASWKKPYGMACYYSQIAMGYRRRRQ